MPRCFMAKKLKYPYEQWKQEQAKSRSPSPPSNPAPKKRCKQEPLAASSASEELNRVMAAERLMQGK